MQYELHEQNLCSSEKMNLLLEHCLQGLKQEAACYPCERVPYISNSSVLMSPQQEHLELLLFPLLSVNDMKVKLRIALSVTDPVHQAVQAFIKLGLYVFGPLILCRIQTQTQGKEAFTRFSS